MIKELNEEITTLQAERHIEFLSKNYNHRITWFRSRDTNELLFAVSYHIDNQKTQELAAIKLLFARLKQNITDVNTIKDVNHYGKKEARKIVKESELVYRTHNNGQIELAFAI